VPTSALGLIRLEAGPPGTSSGNRRDRVVVVIEEIRKIGRMYAHLAF
jgi:hypothetical protein